MNNIMTTANRRYDIDWLRIMLILSVFVFHVGMFFNSFGWHIKNNELIRGLDAPMAYLHLWRMPLLFLISGAGTYFAIGKRKIGGFISERSYRLLIPLVFGMFVIVPPQVFIEKIAQYGNYLNFIPHITDGSYPKGNFSWHHLWFVLYLFTCSIIAIPFILLLRSKIGEKVYALLNNTFRRNGMFLLLSIPLFIEQIVLLQYFPEETHAFVDDWAYIGYSFLFFLYGYLFISNIKIHNRIIEQRRIYGIIATTFTILFFIDFYYSFDAFLSNTIQLFLRSLGDLSISLAILGYAGKYLNRENKWRKYLNEAIYPFYVLHQTVIIVIAYFFMTLTISPVIKFFIILTLSFISCALIYLLLIKPFKITKVLFGMHLKKSKRNSETIKAELKQAS